MQEAVTERILNYEDNLVDANLGKYARSSR
jgi:hypothetical protein